MTRATLYVGDVRDVLGRLPVRHVRCCVTSPPYWGLRSYGTTPVTWNDGWVGELGLELAQARIGPMLCEVGE